MERDTEEKILYLSQQDVAHICQDLDSVAIIREMFHLHATGQTLLPDEAYMGWTNADGEVVRNLNMPGYLQGSQRRAGTKIINGNIANPNRNLPRASGLTLLYDDTTVRIQCIMDSAFISSLRTASVSALAADLCQGPEVQTLAIIGAGVLAKAHIELLTRRLPALHHVQIFDINRDRADELIKSLSPEMQQRLAFHITTSAEAAIRPAQLVIPTTTTTRGYIPFSWLQPGTIIVNVSLDDVLPEVVYQAQKIIIDDWPLVKNDTHRLLGRMYRAGQITGPAGRDEGAASKDGCRGIDAELGELVIGTKKGRETPQDIILVNPFGMAIEDIAIAHRVYQLAQKQQRGIWLER
ncbi:ornithine cyclodeaminase [Dictyobacter alpinus]|uniref:Ornithine cyclodeaminase n=1 Tax=Dictyobacter alpinus TaxID=2014873 RepID=A0A402BIV0_9CHLR|nr:ornithine cyclodeaminase family protein [Dictyobacter alpinus]GCE31303.1 ornithine cyclodeaminase [Dictyobacter alpinus]